MGSKLVPKFACFWLLLTSPVVAPFIQAQDVTVQDIGWYNAENAADKPPKFKNSTTDLKYPKALLDAPDYGYYLTAGRFTAKGEYSLAVAGVTRPEFGNAYRGFDAKPALRSGKAVEAVAYFAYIFNPKEASRNKDTAQPRLLAVAPVIISHAEFAGYYRKGLPCTQVEIHLDANGTIVGDPKLLDPKAEPYRQAIYRALAQWKFSPARQDKKPIAATLTVPVLLAPPLDDLLAELHATTAYPLDRPLPDYPEEVRKQVPLKRIKVHFDIEEDGRISNYWLEGEQVDLLMPSILAALAQWRYEPAEVEGHPIAIRDLDCTLLFRSENTHSPVLIIDKYAFASPIALVRIAPEYPSALLESDIGGDVTVSGTITETGEVIDVKVVKSPDPLLSKAALTAFKKLRFKPATKDGQPISLKFSQDISFSTPKMRSEQAEKYRLSAEARLILDPPRLPKDRQYQVAPKIFRLPPPVYPYEALLKKEKGEATVLAMIDERGLVTNVTIEAASAPEFGLSLAASLEVSQFKPALKKGQPIAAPFRIKQLFIPDTDLGTLSLGDQYMINCERDNPARIKSAAALDTPLTLSKSVPPRFPTNLEKTVPEGKALIEVVINEKGYAFIPKIISASAPEFGAAAAHAVRFWIFSPPLIKGRPAFVRLRVPFVFKSESKAAASE